MCIRDRDTWTVICSDNLYITVGDVRKLATKQLNHGDVLEVKYQDSDNLVFAMEFLIDFDEGKKYERIIDISGATSLTIGTSANCNITIGGEYAKDDALVLTRKSDGFVVDIQNTTYGVYINGKKAKNKDIIKDRDFLSVSDYFFYFKNNKIWTQIRPEMKVNSLSFLDTPSKGEYPKFNRNTRIKTVSCRDDIEILDPPAAPQKPKNNLLTRLLPSMGMLVAAGVMAFLGGAMIIMSVISAGMAIFTSVLTLKQGNNCLLYTSMQTVNYVLDESGVPSEQQVTKVNADDNGAVTYSIGQTNIGLSIDPNSGKITVTNWNKLGRAMRKTGSVSVIVTAQKAAGAMTAKEWIRNGKTWASQDFTCEVYPATTTSYKLVITYEAAPDFDAVCNITSSDPKTGWYNSCLLYTSRCV